MYKVEIVSQRKTINTRWWHSDEDMFDYINETYVDTGKILGKDVSVSEDGLTKTETLMFDSEESYIDYLKDEILCYERKRMRKFNDYHRIAHSMNAGDIKVSKKLYTIYEH